MSDENIRRASLAELRRMKDRGEIHASPGREDQVEPLDAAFWREVEIEGPRRARSVHLKLDPDVFAFFYAETGGKGHLTRMQNVLKAYAKARGG